MRILTNSPIQASMSINTNIMCFKGAIAVVDFVYSSCVRKREPASTNTTVHESNESTWAEGDGLIASVSARAQFLRQKPDRSRNLEGCWSSESRLSRRPCSAVTTHQEYGVRSKSAGRSALSTGSSRDSFALVANHTASPLPLFYSVHLSSALRFSRCGRRRSIYHRIVIMRDIRFRAWPTFFFLYVPTISTLIMHTTC